MIINPQNADTHTLPLTQRSQAWRVTVENGIHWLLDPKGDKFYGSGVNGVDAGSPAEEVEGRPAYYLWNLYGSVDQWAETVRDRLGRWGFNHLGAWNFAVEQIGLPYVANLDLGRWSEALWFDAFDPALPARVRECAERLTAPHRQSGLRIGYFPDNEVGWWNTSLFEFYLSKGWENHTKRLLWQLLHDRYNGDWPTLLKDWVPVPAASGFDSLRDAGVALRLRPGGAGIHLVNRFTFLCAERYYQLMHDGLRAADPQALIFSDRLPIYYSQDAVRAMAPYVDVIAVNYDLDGPDSWLARYFFEGLAALTGKPVLISEFFCAAMENRTGNKNTGHLLKVATQTERAKVVQQALQNFARFPHVVGTHRAVQQVHAEFHAPRHKRDVARPGLDPSKLRLDLDRAFLRDDQKLSVRIGEDPVLHALLRAVEVHRHAFEIRRIPVGEHGHHPVDEIGALGQVRWRIPAETIGSEGLLHRPGSEQLCTLVTDKRTMVRTRTKTVKPAPPVLVPRRRERGAGKLLGIKAEGRPLRAVAPFRKRAFDGLGFEVAAKAAHVAEIGSLHGVALEPAAPIFKRAQPLLGLRPKRAGLAYRAIWWIS